MDEKKENLFSEIKKKYRHISARETIENSLRVVHLNPMTYVYYRNNPESLKNIDAFRFDGFYMVGVLRLFGIKIYEPQSFDFSSLAPSFFSALQNDRGKMYVIGGSEVEIKMFCEIVLSKYPSIQLVGYHDGYFDINDKNKVLYITQEIIKRKADFLLVGLGGTRQEKFISYLSESCSCAMMSCGAFISQTSAKSNYFPPFFKKYKIRWLIRFYREPRVIARVLKYYPLFFFVVLLDWIKCRE